MKIRRNRSHLRIESFNPVTIRFGMNKPKDKQTVYVYTGVPAIIKRRLAERPNGKTFHKILRRTAAATGKATYPAQPTYERVA